MCGQRRARPFPSEKCQERDINLPGSRWDVTENEDLKGRRAGEPLRGGEQTSIQGERVLGPVGCLKPGQEVCVDALVDLYGCTVSVCVCVSLNMPSQTPLLWGGNGQ